MSRSQVACACALVVAVSTEVAVAGNQILFEGSFPIETGIQGQPVSAAIVFGLDEPGTPLANTNPTFLFEDFFWTNADRGARIAVDRSNDADFDHVVGLATNGSDDRMWTGAVYYGGGQSLGGGPESVHFFPGGSRVDFLGYEIHRIELTLDEFEIDVPGSDPNGDGNWTNVTALARLTVYGVPVPEPGSESLLAVAGLILMLRTLRRRRCNCGPIRG